MTWTPAPSRVTLEVEMPTPRPVALDPGKTALVIVDMQNYFMQGRMSEAVSGNIRLLTKARQAGATVIFIRSVRAPDAFEITRFGKSHDTSWATEILDGCRGSEIIPELAPLETEVVVKKWSHDPWTNPDMQGVLDARHIEPADGSVLVSGVSAATCAHACALGFSNRNYMTLIPLDATAAQTVEDEAIVYSHYMTRGYEYNVAFTRSDLVTFSVGAPAPETQVFSGPS